MTTDYKVTELFCIIDEFCKHFDAENAGNLLEDNSGTKRRRRQALLSKMFSIGISDSTTAIDNLNAIANDNAEYYDLQGKRLNEPQKGINIVKRNGKTMKVIIK